MSEWVLPPVLTSSLRSTHLLVIAFGFGLLRTSGGQEDYVKVAPVEHPTYHPPPFERSTSHPRLPMNVSASLDTRPARLQTNGFYTNWLIDERRKMAWTLPYVVSVNEDAPHGLVAGHPRYFEGTKADDGRLNWYANSAIKDIVLTSAEFTADTGVLLTAEDGMGMGAEFLFTADGGGGSMRAYLVRGMAYVTVIYEGQTTPIVTSTHAFVEINGKNIDGNHSTSDGTFELKLNDGSTWFLFVGSNETAGNVTFRFVPTWLENPSRLEAVDVVSTATTIRVAKIPYDSVEEPYAYAKNLGLLRSHATVFPTGAHLKAEVGLPPHDDKGRVTISWRTAAISGATANDSALLLHFALPHHQERLEASMRTGVLLASPTKGQMELVMGNDWSLVEESLPELAWVPDIDAMGEEQRLWVEYHLQEEIASANAFLQDSWGDSVYFGGKHLMAYTQLCLVANKLERWELRDACLDQVTPVLARYMNGSNGNPLVYDEVWGGVVGANGLVPGQESSDFYSALYNDHHFHYSYIVNAAAVMGQLRPDWITPEVKLWVDALVRDVNCASLSDPYFPAFRSFDWFCGHSWARGLLFSHDGKDEESTSEDVNFFYAMAMWGEATGNDDLSRLGRLQLGVLARSLSEYFLMMDDNEVHPPAFVRNKVTGILFEMKVDYTTWFGANTEYIHGIQMIPMTAVTPAIRKPKFVKEEWDQRLAGVVDLASGTWKTLLLMSYAMIEKNLAFTSILSSGADQGLSRTWALFWAATRPQCDTYCTHQEVVLPSFAVSLPWGNGGQPWPLPGIVEAENFDQGGPGVAFFDVDSENWGNAYREAEAVDIQPPIPPSEVFSVGWIESGEWIHYSVDIAEEGEYLMVFAVSSPTSLGSFRVVTGGFGCDFFSVDLTGAVTVTATGGFGNFLPLRVEDVHLNAGRGRLRLCALAGGFNIASFSAELDPPS